MAYLRAFGSYLPERVVTNAELAPLLDVDPEWILQVSGIRERRYADTSESVTDLGYRAAVDCLRQAELDASNLDMLIVASGSSERFCPGPASAIAAKLGLTSTPALDLPMPSAGSLFGLAIASQFTAVRGKVLVIGSEIMSRRIERTAAGRNTALLFGDGAGACLVDAETGVAKLTDHVLFTDGNASELLFIENNLLHMEGGGIILQASRKIPRSIEVLLERNHLPASDVGTFILHQANANLINRVAATLKVPADRFVVNISSYGNTSSASMLIAAAEWHQGVGSAPLLAPLVFAAFGAGLNWGAALALPC